MHHTIWGWNDKDLDDDLFVDVDPINYEACSLYRKRDQSLASEDANDSTHRGRVRFTASQNHAAAENTYAFYPERNQGWCGVSNNIELSFLYWYKSLCLLLLYWD